MTSIHVELKYKTQKSTEGLLLLQGAQLYSGNTKTHSTEFKKVANIVDSQRLLSLPF